MIPFILGIFIVICTIAALIIDYRSFSDTEYLSYKVDHVIYTEDWNEWIEKTCYECVERDSTGTCTREVSYDCSYEEYHPEYFECKLENGSTQYIDKATYLKYKKLWKNNHFINMYRDYYTHDGDRYYTTFDNNEDNFYLYTVQTTYKNYIKGSKYSIFNSGELTKKEREKIERKEIKLFEYPQPNNENTVDPVLTQVKIPANVHKEFKKLNWKYGKKKEIQIFLLIFNNKPEEYKDYQLKYLDGCNKNELFIQLSVNNNQLQWYEVTSWTDDKALDYKVKEYLYNQLDTTINYLDLANTIETNIDHWHRKKGSDYKYLADEYRAESDKAKNWTYFITFIIVLGTSIGLNIYWTKTNFFDNKYKWY